MNRARRNVNKPFVPGGIYNANAPKAAIQEVQLPEQAMAPAIVPPANVPAPIQVNLSANAAVPVPVPMPAPMVDASMPIKEEVLPIGEKMDTVPADEGLMTFDLNDENSNGGKIPFKKIFQKRKKSSERTRVKKLRQNRQLRKSMLPKNALMALNEVKGITISDFAINNNVDGSFTAIVTVNSNQYEGKGQSKMAAKNSACEKALRDYIIAKMTPKPKKNPTAGTPMDITEGESENGDAVVLDDDIPMLNLASFAIYKLFAEWEKEGFVVPEMHPTANAANASQGDTNAPGDGSKEPKKPPVRTELPSNWETMHPATLLCIMRPGITYVDYGCSGEKPNVLQRLGVIVDSQEFTANGRSKKIARRNVAVNVCNCLFGTNFSYEEY